MLISFVEICDLILYNGSDYKGIMINPDTDRIIVDKELLEYIVELHREVDDVITIHEGQSVEVMSIDKKNEPKNIINVLNDLSIAPKSGDYDASKAYVESGVLVNSEEFSGMDSERAKSAVISKFEEH